MTKLETKAAVGAEVFLARCDLPAEVPDGWRNIILDAFSAGYVSGWGDAALSLTELAEDDSQ